MNVVIKFDHSAVATPRQERPNSGSTRCAVFGLVGVLGVVPFILSAVSADDDEIQQVFAQGRKTRQCVARNWKSIRRVRANFVHWAIVPGRPPSVRCSAIERVLFSDFDTAATAFPNRTCGRSPPDRSSSSSLSSYVPRTEARQV
jgi:hypothetical protein